MSPNQVFLLACAINLGWSLLVVALWMRVRAEHRRAMESIADQVLQEFMRQYFERLKVAFDALRKAQESGASAGQEQGPQPDESAGAAPERAGRPDV